LEAAGAPRNYAAVTSREQALVLEIVVEMGDEFAVAVPDLRRHAAVAEHALGRLAPARMRHGGIDVGPEAVLARFQILPERFRALVGEAELDDRLDRLEAVFPRQRQAQRRAVLLRDRMAVLAGDQE